MVELTTSVDARNADLARRRVVKGIINKLQAVASVKAASQKSNRDQEASKATEKEKVLEANIAKHGSKVEQPSPDPPFLTERFQCFSRSRASCQ